MRQSHKTILIWAILILMFVSIYSMFTDSSSKEEELNVTAFATMVKDDAQRNEKMIEKITIEPRGHDDARYVLSMRNTSKKQVVYAEFPGALTEKIRDAGIAYSVKSKDESSIWPQLLVWWLPMLLLIGIFFLSMSYHALLWIYMALASAYHGACCAHDDRWRFRFGLRDLGLVIALDVALLTGTWIFVRLKGIA